MTTTVKPYMTPGSASFARFSSMTIKECGITTMRNMISIIAMSSSRTNPITPAIAMTNIGAARHMTAVSIHRMISKRISCRRPTWSEIRSATSAIADSLPSRLSSSIYDLEPVWVDRIVGKLTGTSIESIQTSSIDLGDTLHLRTTFLSFRSPKSPGLERVMHATSAPNHLITSTNLSNT
jgi:hypothetical protein